MRLIPGVAAGVAGAAIVVVGIGYGVHTLSGGTHQPRAVTTGASHKTNSNSQGKGNLGSSTSEIAFIDGKGYDVNHRTSPNASVQTSSGGTLTAWIGVRKQGDGHNQFVFFFLNGKYLTTDTAKPSLEITSAKAAGLGSIAITYPVYTKSDSFANPTGVPVTITYHWNGAKLVPNKPYPKQFS